MKTKPASKKKQAPPQWRIEVISAPPKAAYLLAEFEFRNSNGVWARGVWSSSQLHFLLDKLRAAGCHGRAVSIAAELAAQRAIVRRHEEAKRQRAAATAKKRRVDIEHQEQHRIARDLYRRAEAVARCGIER